MTLQELLDYLHTLPDTTGGITFHRDDFYPVQIGATQKEGYSAQCKIAGATFGGRGLSPLSAVEKLAKKIDLKYPKYLHEK